MRFKVERRPKGIDVTWGGPEADWYYWSFVWGEEEHRWEYEGKTYSNRRWDFERFWYDGPHAQLSLWYFKISWSTHWTKPPKEW